MEVWLANPENAESIAELDCSCYKGNSLPLSKWEHLLANPDILILIVGSSESPLAYALVKTDGSNNYLMRLAVAEEARNQGIATNLIDILGSKRKLFIKIRETNDIGISFCKSRHFKAVELLKNGFGSEDGILFVRQPNED